VRTWGIAVTGAIAGFALWTSSVAITKAAQPWSASTPRYIFILFAVGAILGALNPKECWLGPLGLYVGEAIGLASQGYLISPSDPPVLYGVALIFLVSYSLACLVGAALSAAALRFYWEA